MVGQFSLFSVLAVAVVEDLVKPWTPAKNGEFPYQVSLKVNGSHKCSGAIVSYEHVVTTAKCVMDIPAITDLVVVADSVSSIDGGEDYAPRKIYIHPDFKRGTTGPHDIAVIALKRMMSLIDVYKYVYLPYVPTVRGSDAILTGWRWAPIGVRSVMEKLMKLTIRLKDCRYIDVFQDNEICASVVSGSSDCLPDKGAPLVKDQKLVGVLSYGNPCDPEDPAVFTNIVHYYRWILRTIRQS